MKKLLGIFGLFVFIFIFTAWRSPKFLSAYNQQNLIGWISLFGIISIGAAFVIITGGIDLSIGSTVGLTGSLTAWLMTKHVVSNATESFLSQCRLSWLLADHHWSVPVVLCAVLAVSLLIGFAHGLLITKMRLQPFVVTLCGLLLYRGLARFVTDDQSQGFGSAHDGLRSIAIGKLWLVPQVKQAGTDRLVGGFAVPVSVFFLIGIAVVAAIFLNRTIWGRYLLAIGRNETAARYSGINTDRMKILAYVVCSLLGGVGGILFSLNLNSTQPSGLGEFYELYAIAAAVLGGCSLRGGEGTILGVIIGTAVMRVLYNAINILGIPTHLEFAIIGTVILAGVIADELVKRIATKRRAARALTGESG
jgi:ribose transport system permease protein